jgi:hypothetical protein
MARKEPIEKGICILEQIASIVRKSVLVLVLPRLDWLDCRHFRDAAVTTKAIDECGEEVVWQLRAGLAKDGAIKQTRYISPIRGSEA